jgi:iron complex outermembrane receptor protein
MLSAQYYVTENTNVYVSYGSSFDTPTLNQVTYNSAFNGSNFALLAAKTKQIEFGLKAKVSSGIETNVALFNANTTDDIVVGAANNGRTSFTNAPKTNRKGVEGSLYVALPYRLHWNLAYTYLDAKVTESYTYTNGSSYTVLSGNRIPGVPNQGLFSELVWIKPSKAVEMGLEARVNGPMAVNDLTANSMASGYAVMNVRGILRQELSGGWSFSQFLRVNNLFNRAYVGSVIVNQTSSQFYEAAPGRNWLLGAKASYQF